MFNSLTIKDLVMRHLQKLASNESQRNSVWEKARIIPNFPQNQIRADALGNLIAKTDYGKRIPFGWHKDHIIPKASGGSNNIENLQPLQWRDNIKKSDTPFSKFLQEKNKTRLGLYLNKSYCDTYFSKSL